MAALGLDGGQHAGVGDEAALSGSGHAAELGGGASHRGGRLQGLGGRDRVPGRDMLHRCGRHRPGGDGGYPLHRHARNLAEERGAWWLGSRSHRRRLVHRHRLSGRGSRRRCGGLQVGDGRSGRVDQLAHLFLHLGRGGHRLRGRRRGRLGLHGLLLTRAVRAERNHHDLADDLLLAPALAADQRVLDDRHHAVRPGGNEARLHRVEQVLVDLNAVERRLVQGGGHVAGRVVFEAQVAAHAEQEDVAQDRAVLVVADDLGDLRDLAPPVRHARLVDDEVHGRGDLRAHGLEWDVDRGHHHHRFQAGQGVARGVGVNGRHASVMARVHGLQHVQGLGTANLTDEDPVGAHSQAVAKQLPDRELALALHVRWAVLERDDVGVVDLELGRVLDGDDALVVRDEACDHVERGRLA